MPVCLFRGGMLVHLVIPRKHAGEKILCLVIASGIWSHIGTPNSPERNDRGSPYIK
jgi:hypothetical protein